MSTLKALRPLDANALAASPEQAALFLSVHRRTVDRLIADRILKARKAGRRVLVDMASIRAYYESLPVIGDSIDHPSYSFSRTGDDMKTLSGQS